MVQVRAAKLTEEGLEGKRIIDRLRAVSLFSGFNIKSVTQTRDIHLGTRPTKRIGNAAQLKRKESSSGKERIESGRVRD